MSAVAASAIDSVEEAETVVGAGLVRDWTRNLRSVEIVGLTPNTAHYVALLVRDEAGHRALYAPSAVTTAPELSADNRITRFAITSLTPEVVGEIDADASTISVTVPRGTDLTGLVATFTIAEGASARIGSVAQVSGTTANDFSAPVVYTVTSQNGLTRDYTVDVELAPPASEKRLLTFAFESFDPDAVGDIDETAHTVTVFVPGDADLTELAATFTATSSATVRVGDVEQVSGTTTNDFSSDVIYTVVAEDGSEQDYTVSVEQGASSLAALSALTLSRGTLGETFDRNRTEYTATLRSPSLTVTATTFDPGATLEIDGATVASGAASAPITIAHGTPRTITIEVTAPDATTTETYSIVVTHEHPTIVVEAPGGTEAVEDAHWADAEVFTDAVDDAIGRVGDLPPDVSLLRVTNDATNLYVAIYLAGGARKGWNNEAYLLIDTGSTSGATTFTSNPPLPWGDKGFETSITVDFSFHAQGNEAAFAAFTYVDDATAGTGVESMIGADFNSSDGVPFYAEIRIPLSLLGVSAGSTIRLITLQNDWDGMANGEVADVLPDSTAPLTSGESVEMLDQHVSYTIQ
ncbi:cadherin-like beta sandwich domain-containing protein [Sandaracinus amylolyticus]|uniref:cadherin-like beta sandwich domain-containing protein n=1 Tax=Sandaracinus amylolyticus TaxID=927083 RepID=UPI001F225B56|nr:cadherin-like beta sandwich domain-containing protein [Sandaracinus amylolyticus]